MYNDDPLRQPGPHTPSYTPKRWQKPHTRTHTLESDKGHTHTLLHSKTGGAGWISLRGWVPYAHAHYGTSYMGTDGRWIGANSSIDPWQHGHEGGAGRGDRMDHRPA